MNIECLYMNHNGWMTCPYDKHHIIKSDHFAKHINHCAEQHRFQANGYMYVCPANHAHHVHERYIDKHLNRCKKGIYKVRNCPKCTCPQNNVMPEPCEHCQNLRHDEEYEKVPQNQLLGKELRHKTSQKYSTDGHSFKDVQVPRQKSVYKEDVSESEGESDKLTNNFKKQCGVRVKTDDNIDKDKKHRKKQNSVTPSTKSESTEEDWKYSDVCIGHGSHMTEDQSHTTETYDEGVGGFDFEAYSALFADKKPHETGVATDPLQSAFEQCTEKFLKSFGENENAKKRLQNVKAVSSYSPCVRIPKYGINCDIEPPVGRASDLNYSKLPKEQRPTLGRGQLLGLRM